MRYEDESSADEHEAIKGEQAEVDQEAAAMHAAADVWHAVRDRGYCNHGSAVGYRRPAVYPEQEGLAVGQLRCTAGCGTVFESDAAWCAALDDPMADPVLLPRPVSTLGARTAVDGDCPSP
jgi:hypothetical protein